MKRNVKMKIEVEENVVIIQDSMSNLEKDEEKKLMVDKQDNLDKNQKQVWEKYYLDMFDYFCQYVGCILAFSSWDILISMLSDPNMSCVNHECQAQTDKFTLLSVFLSILWTVYWGIWWSRFEKYKRAYSVEQILLVSPLIISLIYFFVWYLFFEQFKHNDLLKNILVSYFPLTWGLIVVVIAPICRRFFNKK